MTSNQQNTLLRICSIFHYVVGGLLSLISCLPILYLLLGAFMVMGGLNAPNAPGQNEPGMGQMMPFFVMGGVFITMGGILCLVGFTLAICIIITGRRVMGRRRYGFCMTIAAIECLFMPFGTFIGILTIILLANHDIKESFEKQAIS